MAQTTIRNECVSWTAPDCPIAIYMRRDALEEIRLAVTDAFFSVPHGGAEIGGVLYGSHGAGRLEIRAFRPLACEHFFGPSFLLSQNDHARMRELIAGYAHDPLLRGLEPAGWYHSHTRSEIGLSAEDMDIHNRYFPEPWQIALVLKPSSLDPMRAGFFFRGADGMVAAEKSAKEFIVAPSSAVPVHPKSETGSGAAAAAQPALEPVIAEVPEPEVAPPEFLDRPPVPRFRPRLWILLVALLAAAAGGTAWRMRSARMPKPAPAPMGLAVTVSDNAGTLSIEWDTGAEDVRQARSGSLAIVDGGVRVETPLTPAHILNGRFDYGRQTGQVSVRLSLTTASGKTVEGASMFVGQRPPGPSSQEAQRQLAEAAKQTEQLRSDLNGVMDRNRKLEQSLQQMQERMQKRQRPETNASASARPQHDESGDRARVADRSTSAPSLLDLTLRYRLIFLSAAGLLLLVLAFLNRHRRLGLLAFILGVCCVWGNVYLAATVAARRSPKPERNTSPRLSVELLQASLSPARNDTDIKLLATIQNTGAPTTIKKWMLTFLLPNDPPRTAELVSSPEHDNPAVSADKSLSKRLATEPLRSEAAVTGWLVFRLTGITPLRAKHPSAVVRVTCWDIQGKEYHFERILGALLP